MAPLGKDAAERSRQERFADVGAGSEDHDGACVVHEALRIESANDCLWFWTGAPCTPHGTPGQVGRTWGTRPGKRTSLPGTGPFRTSLTVITQTRTHAGVQFDQPAE